MKTCQPHGYNPPSKCPNCIRTKTRKRKSASKKGWQTRRKNAGWNTETEEENQNLREEFSTHGWLS